MIASIIVLAASSVVILVGSIVDLRDTLRRRGQHYTREEALDGLLDARPGTILSCVGLSAVALLAPALWRDSAMDLGDAALMMIVMGFAAERGGFLVDRTTAAHSNVRSVRKACVTTAVVAGGLAVGMTA